MRKIQQKFVWVGDTRATAYSEEVSKVLPSGQVAYIRGINYHIVVTNHDRAYNALRSLLD